MKSKLLLITIVLLAIIAAIFTMRVWEKSQVTATRSCIVAIYNTISSMDRGRISQVIKPSTEWRVLSDAETGKILSASGTPDCMKRNAGGLLIDYWGNKVEIGIRSLSPESKIEFIVWSDGYDRVKGTSDDIIYPPGSTGQLTK
jgi:hypothetical protein